MLNLFRQMSMRKRDWIRPVRPARRRLLLTDPETVIYAIGDVHGCFDALLDAERRIARDAEGHASITIVMLGDYVDRGPQSADVLDHLMRPPPRGVRRVCLAGNHDDEMLHFLQDPEPSKEWLEFGGGTTLQSYGLTLPAPRLGVSPGRIRALAREAVPQEHIDFLAQLPVLLAFETYLFVHAGIVPGLQISSQSDHDLMWIREPFITEGPRLQVTVVHGHTPTIVPSFGPNRIGIDTGAFRGGPLTVLRLHRGEMAVI